MPTIPQIVPVVTQESIENEAEVWQWASRAQYARLVAANPTALLVRIGQRFIFDDIEATCQDYRRYTGQRGQEATHTVGQLCRALLVKHLKGWSYRHTCAELQTNNLVRWFVGYDLQEATLSFVTLQRFGSWVAQRHPRLFFNAILTQIDQDFPDEVAKPQVGDTFALLANVAPQSRTDLLRDACRRLHLLWQQIDLDRPLPGYTPELAQALFGPPTERPDYFLNKAERDVRETETALAAARCLDLFQQAVREHPPRPSIHTQSLHKWMGLLAKALADEFVCQRDPDGLVISARHATEKERGSFVLGSTVDPEATFRKHGDQVDLGYNVHVAATNNFIREIFVTTGAVPDAAGVAALIAHQVDQLGQAPPKLIYDRAAGSPKTFQAVAQASNGQTQLVARLIDHSQNSQRFGPLDFTLEADGSLTCPGEQSSTKVYRSNGADGWTYRFSAAQCQGCPLWEKCRGPLAAPEEVPAEVDGAPPEKKGRTGPKPTSYRQVFISDYRSQQRLAILYTRTAEFQADMRLRPGIEGTIAALVRYNDARQAHAIGLLKADFQERMAAVAFNLKRWRRLTLAQEKAQRVTASTGPPDAAPD